MFDKATNDKIGELLGKLSGVTSSRATPDKITDLATIHAATAGGASQATGNIIECIIGAATPLLKSLFNGGTMQERLLFALVLAGAATHLTEADGGFGVTINICPETLHEAAETYVKLTGNDIRQHLPPLMVEFMNQHVVN